MVSRRKILSRSRDDLNLDQPAFSPQEEEEDVWYQKDKLYKEHIQEVLDKWTQIDDEIWAKVIVFERNRRVAKAYARAPVLTINGSDDGFDGMRIGLCGFDNPMRDQKTEEFKRLIGQGVKIKMDDAGNILVRRYAKSNVYIKSTASNANEETSIGADILKLPNQALESEKIVKLFDMKKFQSNVNRELRRAYPDRRRLETQCLSAVAFVKSENDILECPIWVLIVNVVAMDMLKSKLPPAQRPMVDIKNRPRIPIPDEDPYSVAGNGSGGSSGSSGFGAGSSSNITNNNHSQSNGNGLVGNVPISNGSNGLHLNNGHVAATREQLLLQTQQLAYKRSEKPPKLPPRDNIYSHDIIPKPDYDDVDLESRVKLARGKSDKGKDNKKYDDPYYCGLRARVPNFVKSSKQSSSAKELKEKDYAPLNNVIVNGHHNGLHHHHNGGMNTLSQKKTSMIHHGPLHMHHPHAMLHHAGIAPLPPPPQHHLHHTHTHPHHSQSQLWQTSRNYESSLGIYDYRAILLPLQQLQQQQPTRSLPPPLSSTTTANNFLNELKRTNFYENENVDNNNNRQRNSTRLGRYSRHQQQHQKPGFPRQQARRSQSSNHRLPAQPHPAAPQERIYYDDIMRAKRHAHAMRPDQYGIEFCNCVSCHALAPLFGAPAPARPPRSLSQQMLSEHRRLSGAGLPDALAPRTNKWCSESDLSEFGRPPAPQYEPQYDSFYDVEPFYDNNESPLLDENDFSMEEPCDFYTYKRQPQRQLLTNKRRSFLTNETPHSFEELRPKKTTKTTAQVNFAHKMRHRQRLPEKMTENDFTTKQAPVVVTAAAATSLQNQRRSLSIESFFEQPNEEGSLYMYGGRRRIVKTPTSTNIYEQTTADAAAAGLGSFKTQHDKDLSSLLEKTKKQMTQLSNKFTDSYKNNSTNNNNNIEKDNSTPINTHTKTLNNKKKNLGKDTKSQQQQQEKDKMFDLKTVKPPLPPPSWRKKPLLDPNNNNNSNITTAANNISAVIAKKIEHLQQKQQKELNNADIKRNELRKSTKVDKNNNNKNTNNKNIEKVEEITPTAATQNQRQSRPTSRVDISDMESIYGYLKPRKPRSLSLKKIQIHDY